MVQRKSPQKTERCATCGEMFSRQGLGLHQRMKHGATSTTPASSAPAATSAESAPPASTPASTPSAAKPRSFGLFS